MNRTLLSLVVLSAAVALPVHAAEEAKSSVKERFWLKDPADLEKTLKAGRGHLDASTIAIVEHNLQIIDQAISQAREALASDPANSYLSSHLVEARRRKLSAPAS